MLRRGDDRERETRWATDAAEAATSEELLTRATITAKMLFRCPVCVLLLVKEDSLCVEAAAGLKLGDIRVRRIPLGKSLSGRVAKRGSPRVFGNVSEYLATIKDNAEPYYSGSLASAPLVFGKQVIGLLNICRPSPATPISNEDFSRLLTYADQTAFAIVSQRRVDQRTEELRRAQRALLRVNERLEQDIAERKRMEQALRESERNYRTLFESSLDGVAVIDAETMKVLVANEAAARLYGFTSAAEVIGLHPLDFIPPDERDRVVRVMAEDMFEKDLRLANEFRTLTRDGREIWISAAGARTEYEGRLAGLMSLRDITDAKRAEEGLRESEERLRALVENAPSAIIVTDLMGTLVDGNRKAEELTGYSKDEMLGQNLLEMGVFSGASLAKAMDALKKQRAGQSSGPDEFELTRRDGSSVFAEITAIPVARSGQVEVISIARDTTERKKADNKERQYIRDLMFLSESATELVEFPPQGDICQFTSQRVKDFVGDCAVVMSTFDDASRALNVRAAAGLVEQTSAHHEQANAGIVGLPIPLDEGAMRGLTSGRLQPVPGGVHELCAGRMPEDACTEFESANAITGTYTIGLASNGKLFGSVAILMRRGAELRNPSIIETFARQASVVLQRRSAEEELRRAHDGLEQRVQMRTAELARADEALHARIAERQRLEESS